MLYSTSWIAPINVLVPCFTTYCFQISGCRFLLGKLIELPLISAAGRDTAAVMDQLLQDFEAHKHTEAYKAAVRRSEKRAAEEEQLSRAIWWARHNLERGRTLSIMVAAGELSFFKLALEDQRQSLRARIKNDES